MATVTLVRNAGGVFVPRQQPTNLAEESAMTEQRSLADKANRLQKTMDKFIAQSVAMDGSEEDLDPDKGRVNTCGRDLTGCSGDEMIDARQLEFDAATGKAQKFTRHSQGTTYWHKDGLIESWFSGDTHAVSEETASYQADGPLEMSMSVRYARPDNSHRQRHEEQSLRETQPGVYTFDYQLSDNSGLHAWYSVPGVFGKRALDAELAGPGDPSRTDNTRTALYNDTW